jgi:hypothetical protein
VTTPVYALDPTQVQVGTNQGPGLYLAPPDTAPPADTAAVWASPWAVLGYISDDGPTVGQTTDTNEIVPWQSMVPLRTVITKRAVTLQFILWQINEMTVALYFDADPPTPAADGSFVMDVRSDQGGHMYAVGIDTADGDRAMRIVFPRANLTDAGDMQIKRGEAVPLDVKVSALDSGGILAHVLVGPSGSAALLGTAPEVSTSAAKARAAAN